MTLSLSFNETAWGYACDKANAEARATHDAAQLAKPEAERTAFVPVPLADYIAARIAGIEASYLQQMVQENLARLALESPESIARMAKVAAAPPEVKDALAAQVDAL